MCYGGKTKANDINPLLLLFKIITALKKQSKCIKTNCKKLHDEFEKKNKKIEENKNKIMLDKKTSLVNKTKLIHKLRVDLLKTKERGEMVKCQLQKCQTELGNVLQLVFNSPPVVFAKDNKKSPYYKFYKKYVHLLKKKNIEYKDIKDMDVEHYNITSKIKI